MLGEDFTRYQQAGHMMYLKEECREDQLAALAEFVAPRD